MGTISRTSISLFGVFAIAWAAPVPAPTFSKDVAPILFRNCVKCHRQGGIASMAPFLSYDEVRPWAKSIRQKVLSHEMPPWPADPGDSLKFRNDARLSQPDINTLVGWVNSGAVRGSDADLPPNPVFGDGWLHPQGLKPDLVISMPGEAQLPATGEIPYVRFLVKVPLSEDKWIAASQARPSNPAVVHHMAITEVTLDEGVDPAEIDPIARLARQLGRPNDLVAARPAVTALSNPALFDMLGVYTPGTTLEMYPEDSAKLLKGGKNLYINFNIHYQTIGKPAKDRSSIAFWFLPGPPKHQLFRVSGAGDTIIANGNELLTDAPGKKAEGTGVAIPPIPAYAEKYELTGVTAYQEPVTIYQFQPHAHFRAKDFRYSVVYPDGREETVLSIPKYDFRWQLAYDLQTPLRLAAGSKMIVVAHYDNSRNNQYNPGPEKEVFFREQNQSWDEMFTPFIQYSIDNQDLTRAGEPRESGVLPIAKVVGCLRQSATTWMLTEASVPSVSSSQSTTSVEVKSANDQPMGNRQYRLLGVSEFSPARYREQRVVAKGVLIADTTGSRLNVTSLQTVAKTCTP